MILHPCKVVLPSAGRMQAKIQQQEKWMGSFLSLFVAASISNGDPLMSITEIQTWSGCNKPLSESHHSWFIDLYLESLSSPDTVCLLRFSSSEKRLFPAALLLSSSPFTPHEILLSFFSSSNDLDLSSGCSGSPRFIMRMCVSGGGAFEIENARESNMQRLACKNETKKRISMHVSKEN